MKRIYGYWLGSYAIIATSLYFYVGVSLVPLLLGGLVSLGATYVYEKKKRN